MKTVKHFLSFLSNYYGKLPNKIRIAVFAALIIVIMPASGVFKFAHTNNDNAAAPGGALKAGSAPDLAKQPEQSLSYSFLSDILPPLAEELSLAEKTALAPNAPTEPGFDDIFAEYTREQYTLLASGNAIDAAAQEASPAVSSAVSPAVSPTENSADKPSAASEAAQPAQDTKVKRLSADSGTAVAAMSISPAASLPVGTHVQKSLDIGATPSSLTQSTGAFIWPASGNLTSLFGYRNATVGSTYHKGIDICGKFGDPIVAADGGEVIVSERSSSYGNVIQIRHDNGYVTLYCHCSSLLVSVGQRVSQGQEIALMGRTGLATAVHLHFEVIIDGENVNPLLYLP